MLRLRPRFCEALLPRAERYVVRRVQNSRGCIACLASIPSTRTLIRVPGVPPVLVDARVCDTSGPSAYRGWARCRGTQAVLTKFLDVVRQAHNFADQTATSLAHANLLIRR